MSAVRQSLIGLTIAATLIFAPAASADTFTVDNSGDGNDENLTIPACETATDVCTLRAAMDQAEAVSNPGLDTIQFALPDPTTITTATQLFAGEDLTIAGPGAAALTVNLDTVGQSPTFVFTGGAISISGLTISGGENQSGGGIASGGTALTLDGVTVSGNQAKQVGTTAQNARGAGISSQGGSLTLKRSTVSANTGTATSTTSGNATFEGGGIYSDSTLTIEQSLISANISEATGVTGSTSVAGGGVFHQGSDPFVIKNSTVSDNSINASGTAFKTAKGGGIYDKEGFTATGDTISLNGATINTNSAGALGGNIAEEFDTATIRNTIISSPTSAPNCSGGMADAGFNIVYPDDCPNLSTASHLNPLLDFSGTAENGGPTKTFKLQPLSPAIDQGKNFLPGEPVDQRGSVRPSDVTVITDAAGGDGSDIGAFEASTQPLTVTTPGLGTGTVTGSGIDCGGPGHLACTASYLDGTAVNLGAAAASGSSFAGWSGAGCAGTGGCMFAINAPAAVAASFDLIPAEPPVVPQVVVPPVVVQQPPGATGQRAAALKKCKKKRGAARKRCKKKANKLPL